VIKVLREHGLATEFERLKSRGGANWLAAPFWGKGAASTLGLRKGGEIRVICRFDAPACNPRALLELSKAGATIRSHRRLHAKLYITESSVIVGSSNPSRNGVTQEGDLLGGSVEANRAPSGSAKTACAVCAGGRRLHRKTSSPASRLMLIRRPKVPALEQQRHSSSQQWGSWSVT